MQGAKFIQIIEVGPRDGLQKEIFIATEDKIRLIDMLSESGVNGIQITSFVNPKRVPQMADAELVSASIQYKAGIRYSALALNKRGVERASQTPIHSIDISLSASDTHSRQNAGTSITEAKIEFKKMLHAARSYQMDVRGGIQCAFGHSALDVEEPIVLDLCKFFLDEGVETLSLADSAGMANPKQIAELLTKVQKLIEGKDLILHLHDTQGMGLANFAAALQVGCTQFDTAFGGLGGCNFIENALGNIPTEDTVNMLKAMGYESSINVEKIANASQIVSQILNRELPGKIYKML